MSKERRERQIVNPAFLQMALLDEVAGLLQELRDFAQAEVPEAWLQPLSLTVTDKLQEYRCSRPWFSFTVFNDGADPLHINVNKLLRTEDAPLNSGESLTFNVDRGKIERLYLWCAAGDTASIRLFAKL